MKIQKIILSLVFIALFLFIFTQSASAAVSCGRVDSNGDHWYQCSGTQITQKALGLFSDSITNFQTSTSTASWTLYDGKNNITNNYSSVIPECIYNSPTYVTYVAFNTNGSMCNAGYSMTWNSSVISSANPGGNCGYTQYQSYYNTFLNLVQQGTTSGSYRYNAFTLDHTTQNSGQQNYYDICRIPVCPMTTPQEIYLTISTSTQNYDLFTAAGSPICPVNVNLTINSGVNISSPITSKSAIWGSQNLPTGSTVKITNNGVIYGMGGDGGQDGTPQHQANYLPTNAGPAVSLIGNTYVINGSGYIFGGGGGGSQKNQAPDYATRAGGGGAGGGIGGIRWGFPSQNGTTGINGKGGLGAYSTSPTQYGGKGGDYGENGENGTYTGGLAGNSVITNSFYLCINGNSSSTVKGPILGTYDTNCSPPSFPTVSLTASSSTVNYNGSSILSWTSTNANSCLADWTTNTATSGSKTLLSLISTKDYSISCVSLEAGGTARTGHSSVLYNGKIYSWGGHGSAGYYLNTLDIYDIATNSWSTGTAGGNIRDGFTSVLYNGKIYSWGGHLAGGTYLNTLDIYDIATNSWSTGKAGGRARTGHSSVLYNGKIYSWGGYGSDLPEAYFNTLDIYDIATNSWSTGKVGGTARSFHSSVLYNGKIYSWGGNGFNTLHGYNTTDLINTLDIYDIATNSWSTGTAGGTTRAGHSSVLYNGKIYSWGGYGGSDFNKTDLNTLDIYDIATNSWSTGKVGGTARSFHSSVLYNGKIYSWGGHNDYLSLDRIFFNTLDTYDITTNSWPISPTAIANTTITVNHPVVPQPPTPKPTFTIQPTTTYNTGCGAKVNLSWTATADTDHYQMFRAITTDVDSNFNGLDSTPTTSYTDASVINGNTYYYRIKACNALNECSDYSSSTSAVVIPPTSDCNDGSHTTSTTTPAYCTASQNSGDKIYVNKQMQWNIIGSPVAIPSSATTTWSGTSITGTKMTPANTWNNIYTTVGLKTIYATSTWTNGNINYTAYCSTSTNVILGGDIIREI